MQQVTLFERQEYGDVCARKHGGHVNSIEANTKVDKQKQVAQILSILKQRPRTAKEIAQELRVGFNQISGRFKPLREANKITYTGQKRENSSEYRLSVS